MGVNKIVYGGQTKLDISNDTVTPNALLEGYTAHDNTGALIVGTASGGGEGGNVWQDANGYLHLDDESGIDLQTKSVTPTETAQSVTPDAGYYALEKVNVGAISNTYVGSGITQRSSSDLTASGATVTAPAGYYSVSASKSVASGTAGTPTATKGTVSNHSVSVTPSVTNTTGYITGGTKTGTSVSVSASELVSGTLTISSSGTKDVTNYASASVASGTAGTPTATKGTVSNHSISVTPSVTNTTGYITGGTKTGTAVTVSASELVSGTLEVNSAGTKDVTNYASASIPSGTQGTPTFNRNEGTNSVTLTPVVVNSAGYINGGSKNGTAVTISASELVSGTKTITENGTGIDVTNYASVDVDVASVSKKYMATITKVGSSDVSNNAYVNYPGDTGTKYDDDGDTFVLTEGNIIRARVLGSHAVCYIFVNNVEVANSGQNEAVSYDYTIPPKTNLSITLYPETHELYIEEIQDLISITSNGKYDVSEYDYADVHIQAISADDYKSVIERTATTPVLPSGLTSIGTYAFRGCNGLALTSLPDGVTSIGTYAFHSCANLALTSLPSGLTSIGDYAFHSCTKLALTSLPDGITIIKGYTFYGCTNLALTSLPDGVTSITNYAFYGCTNLALTSLPSGVTSIGSSAFYNCKNIEVLSIPSGVSTINSSVFSGCNKLETIILRKTDSVCSLANVSALANTPIRGYNSLTGKIYVPSALIESYKTATNWSTIYNAGTVEFLAIEGSEYEE